MKALVLSLIVTVSFPQTVERVLAATFEQQIAGLGNLAIEVRDFIERRATCHHWQYFAERIELGEDDYDSERMAQIQSALKRLRCGDVAKDEAALKQRYARNQPVLSALEASKDWSSD
jgi:hypothetical protein